MNETVHMNTLYYIIITNLKFVSTPTNSSNFFYKLISYKLLMMNKTDQSTTVEDTIIPEDNNSKTRARQSKRRKRSKVRKVEEHGQALDIPNLSLDLIIHKSNNLKIEHLSSLVDQFGYVPYNLIEIGAFSDDHEPQVAMVYPMNKSLSSGRYAKRWLPFPTMLWLSCPTLHTEICELEVDGWVQKLNERLNSSDESAEYLEAMSKAHRLYATERWSLLTDEDRAVVEENGWYVTV